MRGAWSVSSTHACAGVHGCPPTTRGALAIALGWSLYQTVQGVAYFVEGISAHRFGALSGASYIPFSGGPLTWVVGGRILTFDQLVMGLIELGLVLAVAMYLRHIARPQAEDGSAEASTLDQHTA